MPPAASGSPVSAPAGIQFHNVHDHKELLYCRLLKPQLVYGAGKSWPPPGGQANAILDRTLWHAQRTGDHPGLSASEGHATHGQQASSSASLPLAWSDSLDKFVPETEQEWYLTSLTIWIDPICKGRCSKSVEESLP